MGGGKGSFRPARVGEISTPGCGSQSGPVIFTLSFDPYCMDCHQDPRAGSIPADAHSNSVDAIGAQLHLTKITATTEEMRLAVECVAREIGENKTDSDKDLAGWEADVLLPIFVSVDRTYFFR